MKNTTIWVSAGELSGDMQAAKLVAEIHAQNPALSFTGMGGPYLRALPQFTQRFAVEELSVMGFTEVIAQLPRILRLIRAIKHEIQARKPAALIVVDAPSFHFRLITTAYALGIPVYYYISPKIWAWGEKRGFFLKKYVRKILSILPFEPDFYQRFDMDIEYVGNPLVDLVNRPALEHIAPQPEKIGFLPGSRKREVESLLPEFGAAARILHSTRPELHFYCVQAPSVSREKIQALWPQDLPLTIVPPDDRYAFMRSCQLLIAASGTVTLEAALAGTPTIITYKVSALTFAIGSLAVKVRYVGLPNLIMDREIFPELLQKKCNGQALAAQALEWLADDGTALCQVRLQLDELRRLMGEPGAATRAARCIVDDLKTLL